MMLRDNISGAIVLAFFPIERVRKLAAGPAETPEECESSDSDQFPAGGSAG
jgi:hypothetical protein